MMAQKMYAVSRESLMAVRKRTMDSAPTMPRERAMLLPMTVITVAVRTVSVTRETLNLAAVGRAAVRVAVGKENGQAQQRRNGDVQFPACP